MTGGPLGFAHLVNIFAHWNGVTLTQGGVTIPLFSTVVDGGTPSSTYGGTTTIDGGAP